jgi:hypothetical protein
MPCASSDGSASDARFLTSGAMGQARAGFVRRWLGRAAADWWSQLRRGPVVFTVLLVVAGAVAVALRARASEAPAAEAGLVALTTVALVAVVTFAYHLVVAPRRMAREAAVAALSGTVLEPIEEPRRPPPIEARPADRVTFVPRDGGGEPRPVVNRTAREIFEVFDTSTDLQATQVVQPLIGHFLTFRGAVQRAREDHVLLRDVDPRQPSSRRGRLVTAFFDRDRAAGVPPLRRGDTILVRGVLQEISRDTIHLRNAEVLEQ